MSKKPFRFSLIKRQPDEPTIVLASDFNSRPIPWNEIIEVIEVHYDKLEELTAKVKRYEQALQDIAFESHPSMRNADTEFHVRTARAALNQGEESK